MSNSQLLALWEYRGDVPQIELSGELIYEGRPTRYELLKERGHVGRLAISSHGDDGSWDVVLSDSSHRSQEMIAQGVAEAAKRDAIRRVFFIEDELMRIQPNGMGYWYQSHQVMSSFSLGCDVALLTSSQTREMVLRLLDEPSSDVAFALRFTRMKSDEKERFIFGFETDTELSRARAELEAICRLILCADTTVQRQNLSSQWVLRPSNTAPAHFFSRSYPHNDLGQNERLALWAKVLAQFGPLHPHLERLCMREEFGVSGYLARGQLEPPTAHEQLEARLELRAWAKSHLPPDVQMELERLES